MGAPYPYPAEEGMTFSQFKKFLQGNQGIQGWEGRTPMHVQESKPTGKDVEMGDLWYQPSTKKIHLYDGSNWEEIAKRGVMGFDGESGKNGKDGADGKKGDKGDQGVPGKDADLTEVKGFIKKTVDQHEKEASHDPFLIGSKILSEAGMADGMFLQYDGKNDRLVYAPIKQVLQNRMSGRGLSLPSQTGNAGKFLTTDGTRSSWSTIGAGATFVDNEIPSGAINDSNVTYTLANTPAAGSLHLIKNGVEIYETEDYTITGTTITLLTPLATAFQTNPADKLRANYRY